MIHLTARVSRVSAALVSLAVLSLVSASLPGSALERAEGDFWVYSMHISVPGFDVATEGVLRYEFVSQESVNVDGADVPTNVMRVTGSAYGSVDIIDLGASMVMEGYVYEGLDDMSTVRSDMTYWINLTWGSGDFSWPINSASRSVSTYAPALLSGFDPGTTALGANWTENIEVQTLTYNVTTSAVESNETDLLTVNYSVHTELESVPTGAGRFDTLRITATESSGGRVVYWWSEEVGLFVKEDTYVEGESQPVQTLLLGDYSGNAGTDVMVFVAIGGAAMAVALVALAIVLVKRRPPRPGTDGSKTLELLPPPP